MEGDEDMVLTSSQLNSIAPNLSMSVEKVNELFSQYGITSANRIAGFFAQCGHESGDFRYMNENLNYSACSLLKVFPKYFKDVELAQQYERNPEMIASRVYANRMGNSSEDTKDGWTYRGRGFIQLTGKDNYQGFANLRQCTLPEVVSYIETIDGAFESALYFWQKAGLNSYCDKDDIVGMSRRVNGGTNGLEDRKSRYSKYKSILYRS